MCQIPRKYILAAGLLGTLLAGCRTSPQPTQIPEAAFTRAAQTVVAEMTLKAPPATATPTPLPPTNTLQPTETPLPPTETPTSSATALPSPSSIPTVAPAAATLLFEDDFSSGTGWHTEQADGFAFEFKDGGYQISDDLRSAAIWSIRDKDYQDVGVEVQAAQIEGPEDGYYGVVCRHDGSGDNYYALFVSGNGAYGIAKMENGEYQFLQQGQAQPGQINLGKAVNQVHADCIGSTLSLFANGHLLAQVEDDDLASGVIGMLVGSRKQPGVVVRFEKFAIYGP